MIEAIAEKFATSLKKTNEEETASVAVMKYGLIIILNILITVALSLLIGALTDKLFETTVTIISASIIRFVSGGFHFKSALTCTIVSTVIISSIPHITITETISFYFTLSGLLLVVLFAPSNIKGFARIPEKYFPLLKLFSILIVSSNFMIQSHLLALIFLIQGISLIRWERRGKE